MSKTAKTIIWIFVLLITILACILIWVQKAMLIGDRIQAGAIIILIFITGFYAYQTHRLVKEQKKALGEQRNKNLVDYEEKNLQKFCMPLQYRINRLIDILKKSSTLSDIFASEKEIEEHTYKIIDVLDEYGYLAPEGFSNCLSRMTESFKKFWNSELKTVKKFQNIKEETISILEEMFKIIRSKAMDHFIIVDQYYKRNKV